MKRIIISKSIILTLIMAASLIASCSQETLTQTRTVTTTAAGQNITTTVTSTQTMTSTATVTQPVTITHTVTAIPPLTTAGELADRGRDVFIGHCSPTYCHEPFHQDGKAEFENMVWGYYQNAEGLFDFNKRYMPRENPSSLPDTEYLEVTAFMLVGLGKITPETPFGFSNLADIPVE